MLALEGIIRSDSPVIRLDQKSSDCFAHKKKKKLVFLDQICFSRFTSSLISNGHLIYFAVKSFPVPYYLPSFL